MSQPVQQEDDSPLLMLDRACSTEELSAEEIAGYLARFDSLVRNKRVPKGILAIKNRLLARWQALIVADAAEAEAARLSALSLIVIYCKENNIFLSSKDTPSKPSV